MRKLTTALAATAFVAFSGAALACPYAATTVDISKPTTTAEAPISKPATN